MKKGIILLLFSCVAIAGIFFACQKASDVGEIAEMKLIEHDKWRPGDVFRIVVEDGNTMLVISGIDIDEKIRWIYYRDNKKVLDDSVYVDWASFSSMGSIRSKNTGYTFEFEESGNMFNLSNIYANENGMNLNIGRTASFGSKAIIPASVRIAYQGIDFSCINSVNMESVQSISYNDVVFKDSEAKLPVVIAVVKVLKIIFGVACLTANAIGIICSQNIERDVKNCTDNGKCSVVQSCGAICVDCRPNP